MITSSYSLAIGSFSEHVLLKVPSLPVPSNLALEKPGVRASKGNAHAGQVLVGSFGWELTSVLHP